MASIQSKLQKVGEALAAELGDGIVFHYWRAVTSAPMCIWAEDGESSSLRVDRTGREQAISGTVDLFTKEEYDPRADAVQRALNASCSNWAINSVQYEEDTKLIHYEWRFTVI